MVLEHTALQTHSAIQVDFSFKILPRISCVALSLKCLRSNYFTNYIVGSRPNFHVHVGGRDGNDAVTRNVHAHMPRATSACVEVTVKNDIPNVNVSERD